MYSTALDSASPASPNEQCVRLDLDGAMLEIPDSFLVKIISENMPDLLSANAARGPKERLMRLSMKGAMRLFLGYMEGVIVDKGLKLPLPAIPDGDETFDALEYGVYYILGLGISLLSRTDLHAQIEVKDDGTLRVVGLSATPTELAESAEVRGIIGQLTDAVRASGGGKDADSGA